MVELKTEYPFQKADGTFDYNLIKHWAEDENGRRYIIRQIETEIEYTEAVDVYPCRYTYEVTDKVQEEEEQTEE